MYEINLYNIESFLDFENINLQQLKWVEPIFIGALQAHLTEGGVCQGIEENSYIQAMLNTSYQKGKTFSPIENFTSRRDIDRLANHLSEIMIKHFANLEAPDLEDLQDYLRYLFTEIMNNVIDHSHSPIGGFAMAQYYPTKRRIQFVVADRGRGFLKNVQLKRSDISKEDEAILVAMEKGFTATEARIYGQERNAGYGLHAMQNILHETGGSFVIISNNGLVRSQNGKITHKMISPVYRGTIVAFDFYEKNINLSLQDFLRTRLWTMEDEEGLY
jgi:anti-sigma regulatory factor (Ser/Thr protein kinase)